MFKVTKTYTDFNGNERTEDAYFNLTKSELADMHMSTEGGLDEKITKIANAKNNTEMYKLFKDILYKSYGVKSADGRRFVKSPELLEEFIQTPLYDAIFMDIVTSDTYANEFINGLIPKELKDEAAKLTNKQ